MPSKEEAKELLLNGEYELGKIDFVGSDKIKITNNSISCLIDLKKQHGLVRKTISESKINLNPKLKLIDGCLITQLNNN